MPSFPQYLLESFLCLLLFAGFYRHVMKNTPAFQVKKWYLRLVPVAAYGLPLLTFFSFENQPVSSIKTSPMSLSKWLPADLPEFALSASTVVLAVFFFGFVISAFRLMDKCWAICQFLTEKNNRPRYGFGWQGAATACFSQLAFSWEHWDEDKKGKWADEWLPIHPVFAWEFFWVEIFCLLNWWNPVAHWYRRSWAHLYRLDFESPAHPPLPAWKLAGVTLPLVVAASYFLVIPQPYSPTYLTGQRAGTWADQVVFEHKKPLPVSYTIEWGTFTIPLKKYANPNGYEGTLEIELTDFQQILKEEIKIYRGGQPLKPGTLSILYRSGATGEQVYINDVDPLGIVLKDRRKDEIYNDRLGFGDEIVIFGETEDIYLSSIQFHIKDPKAGYEPVVNVPGIDHHDPDFTFQIVVRSGERTLVKLDSEHPNAWRILEMYRDSGQYEIVKIPGFRTNRRYVTVHETLLSKVSATGFDLAVGLPDVNYLPEYLDYQNQIISLHWDSLVAAPSSENYTPEQFANSANVEPVLWIGEKRFRLEAFEIIIAGKSGTPFGYRTDRLAYPSLQHALGHLLPETSVYFDRIVIRDGDGSLKLFPASFAFHAGK